MSQVFRRVRYATRPRIESITKFVMFDDRGTLEIADGLRFSGAKWRLDIRDIIDIRLTGQNLSLTSPAILMVAVAYFIWQGWSLLGILAFMAIFVLLALVDAIATKWVCVTFRSEDGAQFEAYFSDGSMLGWGGVLGGTDRLLEAISKARSAQAREALEPGAKVTE